MNFISSDLEVELFYQAKDAVRRASLRFTGGSSLDLSKDTEVSLM